MGKQIKKTIGKRKLIGTWIILMCLFFAELLLYTWCRVQYVRIGYEISRTTDRYQSLITNQNNLKIELARLKSPQRIEKIAKQQIGLTTPTIEQVIIIP